VAAGFVGVAAGADDLLGVAGAAVFLAFGFFFDGCEVVAGAGCVALGVAVAVCGTVGGGVGVTNSIGVVAASNSFAASSACLALTVILAVMLINVVTDTPNVMSLARLAG
jgi:hypothetical protein